MPIMTAKSASRTGKWVQYMEFVSINKMFICAKETGTFGIIIWENLYGILW